ncbi:ATP-binding protein [Flavobacterium sp. MMLR14_040]|uniref:ATP-binding protein n=1 Tax=Flavobacterium sp. MMLR14_040 TaxID=3093843 RepID=UPI00298FC6B1|nr:ATP-binding protein [Flavobacterium sp. MMLR14_040]MDW8848986.1 ATP-binding protein [Flavobacterium sp. MMLR14_040]
MIPQRIQFYLYILFALIVIIFSCQKNSNENNKPKESKKQIDHLIHKADQFDKEEKFSNAFYYYNQAKLNANQKTDIGKIAFSLLKMSEIQQNNGDYIGSETTATEAIPYINKANNLDYTWTIYRILGINYFSTYNFESSILYYQKAYQLKTDKKRKIAMKNNIALVYREQKKYKQAIQIFKTILNEQEIKNNPLLFSKVLDNLGSCYTLDGNPIAIDFLNQALQIRLKQKDALGLGMSYKHLAEFYKNSNPELSKKYAKLAYEKYTEANCIDDRLNSLELIIKSSNGSELKKNSITYIELVDSISTVRQKAKNEFARIKYDSKKEKVENLELKANKTENELQLERQKNRNIVSYIIIAFSLFLILILYFYMTARATKDKIEATYQSETRISKKLHDELANDIYHTMAFAENKNLSIAENKEQLLNHLDAIYLRTRDISKENSPVITNENYVFYLKEMISGFDTTNTNLLINGLDIISWDDIERNKKIAVYRVLQELLVNMKKHSNATLVGITFKTVDKNIFINYTDNGKGVNIDDITFNNGLHNVEQRVLNIKGQIDIDSAPQKGFKVFFKFPI